MKVTLHDGEHFIADASGDTLRRALSILADKPGLKRYKVDAAAVRKLVIKFEPDFYETGDEE